MGELRRTGTIETKISITRLSTYLHFHFLLFLLFVFVLALLVAGVIWLVNLGYTCIGPRIFWRRTEVQLLLKEYPFFFLFALPGKGKR